MTTEKLKEDVLRERIDLGASAKQAYELYVKQFIASRRTTIFQQFSRPEFNIEKLAELKRCDMALSDLEGQILADISIGKKAEQELKNTTK